MKRKLKKLEQILAENPGWTTNDNGCICVVIPGGHTLLINSSMMYIFGKVNEVIDSEAGLMIGGYFYDESWFEQPVKKKLYAYSHGSDVVFCKTPNEETSLYRDPEFDIEYDNGGAE